MRGRARVSAATIAGATVKTYRATRADAGHRLTVRLTAKRWDLSPARRTLAAATVRG